MPTLKQWNGSAWVDVATGITAGGGTSNTVEVLRGINFSGPEFAHVAATLPGTVNVDYMYPSAASLSYLGSRGHKLLRLPFRWERLQPTLNGPLDAAQLGYLQTAITDAQAAGMKVILDCHNYGRYIGSNDVELLLGDGTLTKEHLADLWSRIATAFKGNAGLLGYGIMNEPHDLPGVAGTSGATTVVFNFDTNLQGWAGEAGATAVRSTAAGTFYEGTGSVGVTRTDITTGVLGQTIRVNDSGTNTMVRANGSQLVARVLVPAGAGGAWKARLEMQNNAYQWVPGAGVSLTPGTWTEITYTPTDALWDEQRAIAVQFDVDNATAASQTVYVDSVGQRAAALGGLTPAQAWEVAAQSSVDAIRLTGASETIYVAGYDWSGARQFAATHPTPFITDSNVIYEAHYYFDRDNSGDYPDTYAAEVTDAQGRGYTDLINRATTELGSWTDWLASNGVKGFLGEFGWPKGGDTAGWNSVAEAIFDILDTSQVEVAVWAAGDWYAAGYNLSIYEGSPLSTANTQAAIVEAHPTFSAAALDPNVVTTNTGQTITAQKTFTIAPLVPNNSWTIANTSGLQTSLDSKYSATNPPPGGGSAPTNMVTTDTAQTITGAKTLGGASSRLALKPNGITSNDLGRDGGTTDALIGVAASDNELATGSLGGDIVLIPSNAQSQVFVRYGLRAELLYEGSNRVYSLGNPPPAPTNMVTTDTTQNITGAKTFTLPMTLDPAGLASSGSPTWNSRHITFNTSRWDGTAAVKEASIIYVKRRSATVGDVYFSSQRDIQTDGVFYEGTNRLYTNVEPYVMAVTGALTVQAGRSRVYVENASVIESVRASVNTAPAGASVIADVNLNGTSIYGTQANRPTIVAGANTALGGAPTSTSVAAGQYITIDVDQIGSTTAGSDLTVVIRLRRV